MPHINSHSSDISSYSVSGDKKRNTGGGGIFRISSNKDRALSLHLKHPYSLLLTEAEATASCFLEQGIGWDMSPHPVVLI